MIQWRHHILVFFFLDDVIELHLYRPNRFWLCFLARLYFEFFIPQSYYPCCTTLIYTIYIHIYAEPALNISYKIDPPSFFLLLFFTFMTTFISISLLISFHFIFFHLIFSSIPNYSRQLLFCAVFPAVCVGCVSMSFLHALCCPCHIAQVQFAGVIISIQLKGRVRAGLGHSLLHTHTHQSTTPQHFAPAGYPCSI